MGNLCSRPQAWDSVCEDSYTQNSKAGSKATIQSGPAASAKVAEKQLVPADTSDSAVGLPCPYYLTGPPLPPCESDRLKTVQALNSVCPLFDQDSIEAPPDPEVASILKLVQNIFQAPAAMVAFFDDKSIFIRDSEGAFGRGAFPWRYSFCAWTMASKFDSIMVIPDATKDSRFADNQFVKGAPGVRLYVGTPLIGSNGHRLGTLCFADFKPREFDAGSAMILNNMAEMVVRHVEKDVALQLKQQHNKALSQAYQNLQRTLDCFDHCVVLLDTRSPGWKILYTNNAWEKTTGLDREHVTGQNLSQVLQSSSGQDLNLEEYEVAINAHKEFKIDAARLTGNPDKKLKFVFRPASKDELDLDMIPIAVPSYVPPAPTTPGGGCVKDAHRYYFMLVEEPPVVSETGTPRSIASSSLYGDPDVIDGLELSHLLGKGAYGSVYFGHWYGSPVAVKVMEQDVRAINTPDGQQVSLEALFGQQFRHPYIVATLKYAVRRVHTAGDWSRCDDTAQMHNPADLSAPKSSRTAMLPRHLHPAPVAVSQVTKPYNSRLATITGPDSDATIAVSDAEALSHTSHDMVSQSTFTSKNSSHPTSSLLTRPSDPQIYLQPSGSPSDCSPVQVSDVVLSPANGLDSVAVITNSKAPSMPGQEQHQGWAVFQMTDIMGSAQDLEFASGAYGSENPSAQLATCSRNRSQKAVKPHSDMNNFSSGQTMLAAGHQTWLVLEYCDKGTLQEAVDRGWLRTERSQITGLPNMTAVLATASEVASALGFLHTHGIVHGDLSAWNVMLASGGSNSGLGGRQFVAKVADFGMARALDIKTKIMTQTYGTVTHMPPETIAEGVVSKATDVYSFGVLLWQMYTGSRPWAGLSHGQIIVKVASEGAQLQFPEGSWPAYAQLAKRCMARDPQQRPAFEEICLCIDDMKRELNDA